MASNLRVDSIVPSTSGNVSIGTATGGVIIPGDLGIAGVLTYEDVTNIDSVGVITARSTIDAQGDVSVADKIIHTGDTNTAIRFPSADTITAETGGAERLRIDSDGKLILGTEIVNAGNANANISFFLSGVRGAYGGQDTNAVIFDNQTAAVDAGGTLTLAGFSGTTAISKAAIRGGNEGSASSNSGYFSIFTRPSSGGLTERLRIGSTGYVTGNVNVPTWFGRQDTAHNVSTATWTTIINLGNDVVNPSMNNSGWDESTGTFTVQDGQAGIYYVFGQVAIDDIQSDDIVRAGISKNDGTPQYFGEQRAHAGEANQIYQAYVARVLSVAVGDTIKLKVYHNEGTTEPTEPNRCYFGGYRLST